MSAYVDLDIPADVIAMAAVCGLVECRDGVWYATPLGERVLREYCARKMREAA